MQKRFYIKKTTSTNNFLKELSLNEKLDEGFLVHTDFQTAGKGQHGNHWESEDGKNLLFSVLLYPKTLKIQQQFILSQLTCLAVKEVLYSYCEEIAIKWANDIYWRDQKICGILIENSLMRDTIGKCIIGIGLNVNQEVFESDAPNPISLRQIIGKECNREEILRKIYDTLMALYREMDTDKIRRLYHDNLYRKDGFHPYIDAESKELFSATIQQVESDGKLILETDTGKRKEYYFKEVKFA
ncbi:MAG: biotin--[acetyl-CoA-carboxylase] ligase [Paludibacteraceae bacterium]